METNKTISFGRIHCPTSRVKIIGTSGGSEILLKPNRLQTQIDLEDKRKIFLKRKQGRKNFSEEGNF